MIMRPSMVAAVLSLLAVTLPAQQPKALDARFVPLRPLTTDVEVVFGDPEVSGQPFVMRIRELPGTIIPPHSHPVDEHITVLEGTFFFAVSDKFDLSLLKELKAGSYAFAPKGSTMFGAAPDGAIVQVHGIGPFHIHWRDGLKTLDDAGAPELFRFRKGDRVTTPRGTGRIRQGYASGTHIQYEIEPTSGTLFMALQSETSPPSPLEQGRALTSSFYEGTVDAVWSRFSDRMRQDLGSVDNLRAFRAQVEEQAGTELAVVEEKVEATGRLHVYVRTSRFSKAPVPVMVQWTLGQDGAVEGFFIRPVLQEAPSERLDHATKAALRLPFVGRWFVFWGGRTLVQNYHASTLDQRFAYDLVVRREGRTYVGDGKRNEDYFCFGQKTVAPAPGTVVSVENRVEDNVPGVMNPKQPMGNHVILDHGNGEFSFLCHFRQGTVAVRKGDQVNAGDSLGLCGNSGNSSEPHLHYHLQDSADFGKGRGLPAAFRDYLADGKPVQRGEPVKGQTIEPR